MFSLPEHVPPLEHQVCYKDTLPYLLHLRDAPLTDTMTTNYNRSNEFTLQTLFTLDDSGRDSEDAGDEARMELAKLDSKLNLLLHWVGKLIQNHSPIPAPCPILLSAQGAQLCAPTCVQEGDLVMLELYLNEQFPQPLELPATVIKTAPSNPIQPNTTVLFQHLSEQCSDLVTKLIFRRHRRQIAQRKRHATP